MWEIYKYGSVRGIGFLTNKYVNYIRRKSYAYSTKIGKSEFYSMERFAKDEIESNKENLYNLINQDKTLHNNNVYDSTIEEQFAKDRKSNE
jgi:hypothetical protein